MVLDNTSSLVLTYLLLAWLWSSKNKKLPPGPKGFPIIGSLHALGKSPHRDLRRLSEKYGPIMHMKLGYVHTIIVSSPQAAELFLKTHDLVFAGRPLNEASKQMSYDQKNLAWGQYGPYWRNMRKMCTLELLSGRKIGGFEFMRSEEVGLMIDAVKVAAGARAPVDVSAEVWRVTVDMTCRMVFGKKHDDEDMDGKGFKNVINEVMHLTGVPNFGDYIPYIGALDLQGLVRRMKKDMLTAGADTSATVVEWTLSELIKHPKAMKKLQAELEKAVGTARMVHESDLEGLEFLDMVIKESMRLHAVAPLLLPRVSTEDCTVHEFHIPKGSRVMVNVWAIGQDPRVWKEPERFWPERFEGGNNVDVKGKDFRLIPFGSGRRGCPGMQLGLVVVRLMVAQLVHCFDWELPEGMSPDELDMTEEFGLTCPRAKHLVAVPTYRM